MRDFLFGDLLISYRSRRGWTQENTVERFKDFLVRDPLALEVSLRTYQKWESGKVIPSKQWLPRIAKFFNLNEVETDEFYRAAAQIPPEVENLPFRRNRYFTGRQIYLKRLDQYFKENGNVAIVLSGLGGIGKTQLALEYAHRNYPKVYRTVLWANATDKASLEASYLSLARLLELPEKDEHEFDLIVQAVKTWLNKHTNWLLILDNADDLQLARSFLPTQDCGHILLTSRTQATGGWPHRIDVAPMPQDSGALLLLRRASLLASDAPMKQATISNVATAREICEELGGLPLALDQAGAYIEETQGDLSGYLRNYQMHRAILLKRRGESFLDHPESVATTLSLSFEKVKQQNPVAANLLQMCAFLAPDAIPEELFHQVDGLALVTIVFDEAILALRRYSLIKRNTQEKTLSIHRLVQTVLRDAMSVEDWQQWKGSVVRVLNEAFPEAPFQEWAKCGQLLPHVLVCATGIEDEPIPTQLEAASVFDRAGSYLREQGQYVEAELLLKQALSIREQHLGGEHLDTAASLSNLAGVYSYQGKYKQAESLVERTLSMRKHHLGAEHPETAKSLNHLAFLHMQQRQYEQAEPLLQQALSINEQYLAVEHPDTVKYRSNLAVLYLEQEQYESAEPLFQQTLSLNKQYLGSEHPETARAMGNLGLIYLKQGRYEQAEPLFQQALSIHQQSSGAESPDTAYPLYGLAELCRAQGKFGQAEPLFQQALSIRRQHLEAEHLDTAESLEGLGNLYQDCGRYKEAELLYAQALTIREKILGREHPSTQSIRKNYTNLRQKLVHEVEEKKLEEEP